MAKISVTPEQLKEQAKVYTNAKKEIETAIQKVNKMNDTIKEEWKGKAFDAYLEQYKDLYDNVKKFEQLLEDINSQLDKYADTIQKRDEEDAKSFGF